MGENPAFYATAAQIIPLLVVVTVLEERLRPRDDPLKVWGALRFLGAGLFTLAELVALLSLADRTYTEFRTVFVMVTIFVGLVVVMVSVAPPPIHSANTRPLVERYQGRHRARRQNHCVRLRIAHRVASVATVLKL
jgi:hypothetical protein